MHIIKCYKFLSILVLLVFTESCVNDKVNTSPLHEPKVDSLNYWFKLSKLKSSSEAERIASLNKAYALLQRSNDTLKHNYLSDIAYSYFELKDSSQFKKVNKEALRLALKLKDTLSIADINWSYADFYNKQENYSKAYYYYDLAYKYFIQKNADYETGRMLYAMSYIKGRYRDYSGSEILNIKAIERFRRINNYKYLYTSYNHLAVLQNDIDEYDRSLFYHEKALNYLDNVENKSSLISTSFNNIGSVYLQKKQYEKALEYFDKALKNAMTLEDSARIIDNIAYGKFLSNDTFDTSSIENSLKTALAIRDSLDNKSGVVVSKKHLAEFYLAKKDTLKALSFVQSANTLAKSIKNNRDYLTTLKLLARIDKSQADYYLNEYIKYEDSLKNVERQIQNKFTRIAFETDDYIEETKRLSQQKVWISLASTALILILLLLFYIRVQKSKNEKLVLEGEQQRANEQVYLLTLRQQSKLQEERIKERNRISEELHDGILGRLFGTRMGLGFLEFKGDDQTLKQQALFLNELQDIEKEIREVSHRLHRNFESSQINFEMILHKLLEKNSQIGGYQYQLEIENGFSWVQVNEKVKVNLYRIIQESLQNIIKHAKAKHVKVIFTEKNVECLELRIIDDGVGFNIKKNRKGIGLKNIHSRVKKLGGQIEIKTIIGNGTELIMGIPFKNV